MDKNGLLEIIAAHRKDDDLDEVLRKNKDYQEALAQQKEAFSMLDDLGLTAEQEKVIDQAITANNHTGAVYGAVAYRLGKQTVGTLFRKGSSLTAYLSLPSPSAP